MGNKFNIPRLRLIAPRNKRKFDKPRLAEALANRAILMGPDRLFTEAFPLIMRIRRPNVASVILQVSWTAATRPSAWLFQIASTGFMGS